MVTVIIAGGSGTRLWPLSTPDYPKHLLQVNGQTKSLLQNTYERVHKFSNQIFVITEDGHAQHVKDQLPDLTENNFIIEPARRGTASCIVAGLAHMAKLVDHDEPIAFVHSDHYVRDVQGFEHSFRVAEASSRKDSRIVLVGVEPDHPATGFGYIEKGDIFDEESFVYNVRAFKEKPDHELAQQYVQSGNYLWNCGYFVGSINTFLNTMKTAAPKLKENYDALAHASNEHAANGIYLSFENVAIDYALIEKVRNLLVVPASFDWMDLGSFSDLHKAADCNEEGNHVQGAVELLGVQNSYVQNDQLRPIAVIGLDNVVVVNTDKGLLVTRKDMSQAVGDIAKKIHARGGEQS